MCSESLLTHLGLHHPNASFEVACGLCGKTEESGLHVIAGYMLAHGVWDASGWRLKCQVVAPVQRSGGRMF